MNENIDNKKTCLESSGRYPHAYEISCYFCILKRDAIAMPGIKCSLIISTYNWPAALELVLKSVSAQAHLPDEVIIADDGSGDDTKRLIDDLRPAFPTTLIHVWHEDKGFRKTIILNKAIHKSSGDYIIQVDGDVILEKHFIRDHLASAEPATFLRGTRALLTEDKTREVFQSKNIKLSPFSSGVQNRNNSLRLFALRAAGSRKVWSSNSVRGSNLSFWKADFIKVNGYNNDISGWGHEDEELAARFINSGVIKKIIKLCAVQYHLYHPILSKKDEPWQRELVDRTKIEKVQFCKNSYQQSGI